MSDNPFTPKVNKKQYIIVFGDVGKYITWAKILPSQSLTIEPFAEKLKRVKGSKLDDPIEILAESQQPAMLFLMGFFKDLQSMKDYSDKDPSPFMGSFEEDDDGEEDAELGLSLFGIGRELFSVEIDRAQVAAGGMIDRHRFPEDWDIAEAPVMLRTGKVKSVSKGFAGMLDFDVLNFKFFKWNERNNLSIDDHEALPFLHYMNTWLLNPDAFKNDPNAPFTIYVKKGTKDKTKPTLKVV